MSGNEKNAGIMEVSSLNIAIYEEEKREREKLRRIILSEGVHSAAAFDSMDKFLEYIRLNPVNVVFISLKDAEERGYFLIKEIRKKYRDMNVVVWSDNLKYGYELMQLRISGYITGGLTRENVAEELGNLRYKCMALLNTVGITEG